MPTAVNVHGVPCPLVGAQLVHLSSASVVGLDTRFPSIASRTRRRGRGGAVSSPGFFISLLFSLQFFFGFFPSRFSSCFSWCFSRFSPVFGAPLCSRFTPKWGTGYADRTLMSRGGGPSKRRGVIEFYKISHNGTDTLPCCCSCWTFEEHPETAAGLTLPGSCASLKPDQVSTPDCGGGGGRGRQRRRGRLACGGGGCSFGWLLLAVRTISGRRSWGSWIQSQSSLRSSPS